LSHAIPRDPSDPRTPASFCVPSPVGFDAHDATSRGGWAHARLGECRVGIAGCGGLGSTVAVALARSGIGALTLVDFDLVESSNLNRQQYFIDQIGLPKVDALAANLRRISPHVQLVCHRCRLTGSGVPSVFGDCTAVAECFDNPASKAELLTAMTRVCPSTSVVGASGIAGCGPASGITCRRVFGNHFVVGDGVTGVEMGVAPWAPRVTVAAGFQANVIVRLLLDAIGPDEGE
jgi:sulfur carrier protein ThiS adenylyltransferase